VVDFRFRSKTIFGQCCDWDAIIFINHGRWEAIEIKQMSTRLLVLFGVSVC
jgi:hypothetical protein